MQPQIYGIGNPLIDILISATDTDLKKLELAKGVMHLVDEVRQSEIIQYFNNSNHKYMPGGSAPNTILACAGLGISSLISGKIGDDKFGNIYEEQAKQYGAINGLVKGSGVTGSSIILVTPDGERTMNTHLGMCCEFSPEDINESKLAKSNFLYFTGYMWDTDSQKNAINYAISIAKENDVQIIFDVADPFVVDRNSIEFLKMIEQDIDIVFANQTELAILFDSNDIEKSTNKLLKIVKRAGIKLGKKGSLIIELGEKHSIPSRNVNAIDSTGAGDMYAAGFLSALSKGYNSRQSGEIGGRLAEEIIQQFGAQFDLKKMSELNSKVFSIY